MPKPIRANEEPFPAGVAAGHPATTDAGIEILEDGGTAADAAVAACLASCVAETLMTGFLGGGHAIYWDSEARQARNLDCFVAVPGLGGAPRTPELISLEVPFGAELVHYAVGPASCGVPGLPAGVERLWQEHGRLPWPRLIEPALALARSGASLPAAHSDCLDMLEPVMTMNEGARIYAPAGRLLRNGDTVQLPGMVETLETLAAEGCSSIYSGTLADRFLAVMTERGGLVTRADLDRYEARWSLPTECAYRGCRVLTRRDLSGIPETLPLLPTLAGLSSAERVVSLTEALAGARDANGHTTNLVTADSAGNACVLTTSLGLGSGDWIPGLDLHLNSMLGEVDLLRGAPEPGQRMHSMMAPTLALDDGETVVLAGGAAGGTRLRTALVGVIAGMIDEGLTAREAVVRPRFHPAGHTVNAEPGVDELGLGVLEGRGWAVRRWPARHHYFGGVSVITRAGAAGDPRRSGSARLLS